MKVSLLAAFVGGLGSFLSPCVLPLIPVYISFITGYSIKELKEGELSLLKVLTNTVCFILGFSTIFIALGASATFIGDLLNRHLHMLSKVLGILVVILGIHIMGLIKIGALQKTLQIKNLKIPKGALGALVLGMAFSLAWSPCVGPILGSILAYASTQEHVREGVILLAFYSMGLALPFLLFALLFNYALPQITRIQRASRALEVVTGLVLIGLGIMMIKGGLFLKGVLPF